MPHPDILEEIDALHAFFRQIIVDNLTPEQYTLYEYFSMKDPLFNAPDDLEEFPLFEGIPEFNNEDPFEEEDFDEEPEDELDE
jgi:hypothetical protein